MPIPTIDEQTRLTISNKSFSIYTPFTDPEALDPYFFDPGYTLAAQTAHSIWEGANIFLNFLTHQPNLQSLLQKYKSIELGTGTGVCGIGIGVIGGSCLLTDINSTLSTARTNVLLNFKKESWDGNSGCAVQALDWSDLDLDMSGLRNVKDAR